MRINGKEIAAKVFADLKKRVEELAKDGVVPHVVIILVGNDPASIAYVRQKELKAAEIGGKSTLIQFDLSVSQDKLLKTIEQLNNDNNVHGIIVQRPLPPQINNIEVNLAVDPKKDIDAFHPQTLFPMPLAAAVLKVLEKVHGSTPGVDAQKPQGFVDWLKTKNIVVMGKGETGGGPVITLLKKMNIEPIVIDSKTQNPESITKHADIIVATVGKPGLLTPDMLKKGVILLAVGMHRGKDGKLHGDYNENEILNIAAAYTPIPGGIGPVNVAMLLTNLVKASKLEQNPKISPLDIVF